MTDPSNQAIWLQKGNELFNLNDYYTALTYFEKAIKINSDNQTIWLEKGNELFKLRECYYALDYYSKAMEINPNIYIQIREDYK